MKKHLIGNFAAPPTFAGQTEKTLITQHSFAGADTCSHGGGSGGISATIPDGNG